MNATVILPARVGNVGVDYEGIYRVVEDNAAGIDHHNVGPWIYWDSPGTRQFVFNVAAVTPNSDGIGPPIAGEDRATATPELLSDILSMYRKPLYEVSLDGPEWEDRLKDAWKLGVEEEIAGWVSFISRWGPVELCHHLFPAAHCRESLGDRVPLMALRFYVRYLRALLAIGVDLRTDPSKQPGMPEEREVAKALLWDESPIKAGDAWVPHPYAQSFFGSVCTLALLTSGAAVGVIWNEAPPEVRLGSASGVVAAAVLEVVAAVAVADAFQICSNVHCRALIDTRTRRRAVPKGQHPWCADCRERGIHKLQSAQTRKLHGIARADSS